MYIPPHLIILHLAAPVSPSTTTTRHRACALGGSETTDKAQQGEYKVLVATVPTGVGVVTDCQQWSLTY